MVKGKVIEFCGLPHGASGPGTSMSAENQPEQVSTAMYLQMVHPSCVGIY